MQDHLHEIKVILAKIETDLRHHVKRTELLEEDLRKQREEFTPLRKEVATINGLIKALMVLASVATAVGALLALK